MSNAPPPSTPAAEPSAADDELAGARQRWAVACIARDGTITAVNPAGATLAGMPADQVVGHHYLEFTAAVARSRVDAAFHAVIQGAPAATLVAPTNPRSGPAVVVAWTVVPTRDHAGEVTGAIATGMPLPDVAPGEPEHAAEQFWRDVFDANPLAVAVIDGDDRVLGLNACFTDLFGYEEREALGRTLHQLIDAPSDAAQAAARQLAAGDRVAGDVVRRAKHGGRVVVHAEAAAFQPEGGRHGLVVTYRLVRDQRQYEAQVLRAQHLEGVALVASGVLHDVNNLLMVVVGQADLLADAPPDAPFDAERREDLVVLRDAARRAAGLARTVGSFARPRDARPELVDVAALVERLRAVLAGVVGRRTRIEYEIRPTPTSVRAVPAELEQVVLNLAANARDAMPSGGTLRVRVLPVVLDAERAARARVTPGPYVALDVADTGAGMRPEVARRVFEPFFTTKAEAGTGLGLATVQRIVRRTGGDVAVESAEGAGTTVHVLLPAQGEG